MTGPSQLLANQISQFTPGLSSATTEALLMQDYVSPANTSTSSVSSGSTSIMAPLLYGGGLSSTQSAGIVAEALPSLISIGRFLSLLPKKLVNKSRLGSSLILQSYHQLRADR